MKQVSHPIRNLFYSSNEIKNQGWRLTARGPKKCAIVLLFTDIPEYEQTQIEVWHRIEDQIDEDR